VTETPAEQGRHRDLEDPRTEKAEDIKRQREADSAESGPSGDGSGAPALGDSSVTSGGTSVTPGDEAARAAGAPSPPPGAQR
jgi:hypothetical protein